MDKIVMKTFDEFSGSAEHKNKYKKFKEADIKLLLPFADALLIRPPRLAEPIVGPFQNDGLQTDVIVKLGSTYRNMTRALNYWLDFENTNNFENSIRTIIDRVKKVCEQIPESSNVILVNHWTGSFDDFITHDMYETVNYYGHVSDIFIQNNVQPFHGTGTTWLNLSSAFSEQQDIRTIDIASNGYHATNEAYCIKDHPTVNVAQYNQSGIFLGQEGSVMISNGGFVVITANQLKTNVHLTNNGDYETEKAAWGFQFQARNFWSLIQDALVLSAYICALRDKKCRILITDHSSIRLAATQEGDKDKYKFHYDYGSSFSGIWLMFMINRIVDKGDTFLGINWNASTLGGIYKESFSEPYNNTVNWFGVIDPITEDVIGYYELGNDGLPQSEYAEMQMDLVRKLKSIEAIRKDKTRVIPANTVYLEVPEKTTLSRSTLYCVHQVDESKKDPMNFTIDILFHDAVTYAGEIIAQDAINNKRIKFEDLLKWANEALDDLVAVAKEYVKDIKNDIDSSFASAETKLDMHKSVNQEYINYENRIKAAKDDISKATSPEGLFGILRQINTLYSAYLYKTNTKWSRYISSLDNDCVDPYDLASPANRVCYGLVRTVTDVAEDIQVTLDTVLAIADFLPIVGMAVKVGKKIGKSILSVFQKVSSLSEVSSKLVKTGSNVGKKIADLTTTSLATIEKTSTVAKYEGEFAEAFDEMSKQKTIKNHALKEAMQIASTAALSKLFDNSLATIIHNRFLSKLLSDFIAAYSIKSLSRIFKNVTGPVAKTVALNSTIHNMSGLFRSASGKIFKLIGWPVFKMTHTITQLSSKTVPMLLTGATSVAYYLMDDEIVETIAGIMAPEDIDEKEPFKSNNLSTSMIFKGGCDPDKIVEKLQQPISTGESNVLGANGLTEQGLIIDASDYDGLVIRGDNSVLIHRIPGSS